MAKLVDNNIHNAMRNVAEALKLDGQSRVQEAYIQYLQSVHFIVQVLLEDARTHDRHELMNANTRKFINLGQQCMERVSVVADKLDKAEPSDPLVLSESPSPPYYMQSPTSPTMPYSNTIPHSKVSSFGSLPQSPQITNSPGATRSPGVGVSQTTVTNTVRPSIIQSGKSLGPMEAAFRQNHLLMAAYKSRVAKMNSGDSTREFNLSLTLQRRMAENVAIARAQEESLARKMRERQRRLEEQAARRFASTTGMSKDEQERRHVYTEILMYEHDHRWPLSWRERLKLNPEDPSLIQDLVKQILSAADHPLTVLLKQYQFNIYNKINPLVSNHINQMKDIRVPYHTTAARTNQLSSPEQNTDNAENRRGQLGNSSTTLSGATQGLHDALSNDQSSMGLSNGDNSKSDNASIDSQHGAYDVQDMDDLFDDSVDEQTELSWPETESPMPDSAQKAMDDSHKYDSSDVPVTEEDELVRRLTTEGFQRHLRIITKDVHVYLDKLHSMFMICYEDLDSPTGRDVCYSSIEEPFFKPIWGYLLTLFRLANEDKEVTLAHSMTAFEDLSPQTMKVSDKLTLMPSQSDVVSSSENMTTDYPYKVAVEEIRKIPSHVCPLNKLECIVQVNKLICQCVIEYYEKDSVNSVPTIGADDLLPILSYVVIRSKMPHLVSECHAMGEFIHEAYLMGEEGYCLTSLQTALGYVTGLAETGI